MTAASAATLEPHLHEFVRRCHRQRTEAHGVEQLEDRGVGADAEGERKNGGGGKHRLLAQLPQRQAHVAGQVFDNRDAPGIATLFLALLDSTDGAQGRGTRVLSRHALCDVLVDLSIDVIAQLIVELVIERRAAQQ